MRKKELFFIKIFLCCFALCGLFLLGSRLEQGLEIILDKGSQSVHAQENELPDDPPETEVREPGEENITSSLPAGDAGDGEDVSGEEMSEETESETPAETEAPAKPANFFDNTLMIGDSRMVGLQEYGHIEGATFFAASGMSVFSVGKNTVSVEGEGKLTFEEVLERQKYDKIYLMLGINELGYRFERVEEKYKEVLEQIREKQEDATIYLCANLHVTKAQSVKDSVYNNEKLDRVNRMIADLADRENTFYLDVNELFDDEQGNLAKEYSSDAFHVYGKYYLRWVEWLEQNG